MSSVYDGVPPQVYEVTWMTGHTERVIAHQVTQKSLRQSAAILGPSRIATEDQGQRIVFHAEVDGSWTLQLSALAEDIRTIRNITNGEQTPGGAA